MLKEKLSKLQKMPAVLVRPFQSFFRQEVLGSALLLVAALFAFLWANSGYAGVYHRLWATDISLSAGGYHIDRTLQEWINEGLMAVFFFLVGLEIKRELLVGELASFRKAILPAGAAVGGMLFPAVIYLMINRGTPSVSGWGIPMATDIAFALGALYVLGEKVPSGLRVFLASLAIVDDLGAVLVIALFYTRDIAVGYLFAGLGVFALMVAANIFWVRSALIYAILAVALWLSFLGSGLHATIAGVIVAFCIPARGKYDTDKFVRKVKGCLDEFECAPQGCGRTIMLNERHLDAVQSIELACHNVETPLQRFERGLQAWVAFLIVPLFALANAGLTVGDIDLGRALSSPVAIGVGSGLIIGKPLGITFFTWVLTKLKVTSLPEAVRWRHILGAGILSGIGFTMSLFITDLSFAHPVTLDYAKAAILFSSVFSGAAGLLFLSLIPAKNAGR